MVALGVVAWGAVLIVVPDALYWDDWVTVNGDSIEMFRESGYPWVGYLTVALYSIGPVAFKCVGLVCTIVVGIASYRIAGYGFGFGRGERWLIAALVIVLPLNLARAAAAILQLYSLSLAVFMIAWLLLVRRASRSRNLLGPLVALPLLMASYTTASLLVFTVVPVAHLAWVTFGGRRQTWRNIGAFVLRYWFVLAAPVAFWVLRAVYFQPSGVYREYNSFVSFSRPLSVAALVSVLLIAAVVTSAVVIVVLYLVRPLPALLRRVLAVVTALGLLGCAALMFASPGGVSPQHVLLPGILLAGAVICAVPIWSRSRDETGTLIPLLATSLFLLGIGALPYALVNKLPTFSDWDTRNQLLLPFGVAIVVLAIVRLLGARRRRGRVTAAAVVAVMCIISSAVSVTLIGDARKQEQVIDALSREPKVRDAVTVVFRDESREFNFGGRTHAFYEYTGWLWSAFGSQTRLGVGDDALRDYLEGNYDSVLVRPQRYGLADFVPSTDGVLVDITAPPGATIVDLLLGRPAVSLEVTPIPDLSEMAH